MTSTAPDSHLLGYARSRTPLALDRQRAALVEAGVDAEQIFSDRDGRDGLDALLAAATPGTVVLVHDLTTLGSRMGETVALIRGLHAQGVGVRTLKEPSIDTSGDGPEAVGALRMLDVLAPWAEIEDERMLARAGRRRILTDDDILEATRLRDVEHMPMRELAERTGVGVATLHRRLPARP
ncbi:MAG TPA: recombinase family protein [Cellulomonas sp.]|nr:recombinase family protein [Cellulomonas sp.]